VLNSLSRIGDKIHAAARNVETLVPGNG
jgi:hypothetical protein